MAEVCPTCPDEDEPWRECPNHVGCDDDCKALRNPVTPAQFVTAYRHWRDHGYLSGCSHGG